MGLTWSQLNLVAFFIRFLRRLKDIPSKVLGFIRGEEITTRNTFYLDQAIIAREQSEDYYEATRSTVNFMERSNSD